MWGQVQGQGLVHSQGIKVFPGSGSEQVPMLPQGSTPHVVPELPSPISNSYIKPYCWSVQKGPSEVIPLNYLPQPGQTEFPKCGDDSRGRAVLRTWILGPIRHVWVAPW